MPQRELHDTSVSLSLSAEDVRRLLSDETPAARVDITQKIAGAYGQNQLTEKEQQAAEQIFRLLVRDTEVRVRQALSQGIKDSPHIPRDIVLPLARDVAQVALPVLQFSQVLNDDDLLELIQHTDEIERYVAISQRPQVSYLLSGALLDKGHDAVAVSLVKNEGAEISENSLDKILAEFRTNETVMKAMADRPRLPMNVVEKLIHVVSSSIGDSLKNKYNLSVGTLDKEVDHARENETLKLVRQSHSQEEIDALITQLLAFGRLNPSLILSSLCQGDFAFFETSLARLSGIPVANARRLISDRGELGFRAIYNKSGLPDAMFPAVKLLLKVMRDLDAQGEKAGSPRYANRVVEHLLQFAEQKPIENLSYIIALVRRIAH